jgi:phosphatidylinositol alpha-1,6-mannosyltransferase
LGAVSDTELSHQYQDASVFVLTPEQEGLHFEGFGLVYLEAGAYGLPVVGTQTGGVPDAVREGITGFLVRPGDVDEIAAAALRLLDDPELARQMGRANRRWAEQLTWERNAEEQIQAYRDILEI